MAAKGDFRVLPIPRCAGELASTKTLPLAAQLALVACASHAADSVAGFRLIASGDWWIDGFRFHVFCTLTHGNALTPCIQGGSRMHSQKYLKFLMLRSKGNDTCGFFPLGCIRSRG